MKKFHRRRLLKKAALAGLSIGSAGSLVSCSASGGDSGKDDNATIEIADISIDESDNISDSYSAGSFESSEADGETTVELESETSVGEPNSAGSSPDPEDGSSESVDNATVELEPETSVSESDSISDSSDADLIIDTTDASYRDLANTGGTIALNGINGIPNPGILIHRSSPTSADVVSRRCTHSGCPVSSNYVCVCHNSVFAKDGSVLQGPASSPLTTYSATISGTNILINFS